MSAVKVTHELAGRTKNTLSFPILALPAKCRLASEVALLCAYSLKLIEAYAKLKGHKKQWTRFRTTRALKDRCADRSQ